MEKKKLYAIFAGFGDQYWVNVRTPDIRGKADGLTTCLVDRETGKMEIVAQSHGVESPSTLVFSKDRRFIYCTNETHDYKVRGYGGGVTAFTFNSENGETQVLNDNYSFGSAAAYITIDPKDEYLFVANCGSKFYCSRYEKINGKLTPVTIRDEGVVTMFEILPDGRIGDCLDRLVLTGTGADPVEHASAHPHSVIIDDEDYMIIPNKGGDSITVAKLNRKEKRMEVLSEYKCAVGTSPRHAAFVNGTDIVLVQEEFGAHINSFMLDRKTGKLSPVSRIDTFDPSIVKTGNKAFCGVSFSRPWGIDVQVHPNGRFVYVNNTQPSLSVFELDRTSGELTKIQTVDGEAEKMTRGIQIDSSGTLLMETAPMDNKAILFRINPETGCVSYLSSLEVPTPTAVRFIEV